MAKRGKVRPPKERGPRLSAPDPPRRQRRPRHRLPPSSREPEEWRTDGEEGSWSGPERGGEERWLPGPAREEACGSPGREGGGGPRGAPSEGGRRARSPPAEGRRGARAPPGREGRGGPRGPSEGERRRRPRASPDGEGRRRDPRQERDARGGARRGPPVGDGGGPWSPPDGARGGAWSSSERGGRSPPEREGRGRPWASPERERRGTSWGALEREGRVQSPQAAAERRERDRARPQRDGRGLWGSPEGQGRGRLGGSPERATSPPRERYQRESWSSLQEEEWREGNPEAHQRGPPSHAARKGSSHSLGRDAARHERGTLRSRWGSPQQEAREEAPSGRTQASLRGQGLAKPRRSWQDSHEGRGKSSPPVTLRESSEERGMESPPVKLRRTHWDGPEGREGEQTLPSRRQVGRNGSPKSLRRLLESNRASRSRREGPSWKQLQRSPMGDKGRWSDPEEMECPPGEVRDWSSPSRARWPASPTGEQRDWGGQKWEERRHSGRFRSPSPLEEGHRTYGGGRWSSPEWRGRRPQRQPRGDTFTKPSSRQQSPQGNLQNFQGGWSPRGDEAGMGSPGRDWNKEVEVAGGDGRKPEIEDSSTSPAAPTTWVPCEEVANFWSSCRVTLKKKIRQHLLSTCPRPTLPSRSTDTPQLNSSITAMLKPQQLKELLSSTHVWHVIQDEVLDMLAPAMTIYEMAVEALGKGEAVEPLELREWARRLIRYIGSIHHRITFQRRSDVLSAINPRLKRLTTKMAGWSTDGLLFAEDKVKLLKEIIKRFPQLALVPKPHRRFHPFVRLPSSTQRFSLRSGSRSLDGANQPYRQTPAGRHENQEQH